MEAGCGLLAIGSSSPKAPLFMGTAGLVACASEGGKAGEIGHWWVHCPNIFPSPISRCEAFKAQNVGRSVELI